MYWKTNCNMYISRIWPLANTYVILEYLLLRTYVTQFTKAMEDGGVDISFIDSRQHEIGQMADFPPPLAPLAPSLFDL